MGFFKKSFNNVPEALTLNNPDEETASDRFDSVAENHRTQSGEKKCSPSHTQRAECEEISTGYFDSPKGRRINPQFN